MAAVSFPLRIRKRCDLVSRRQAFGPATYWVVKDPLALRYFRLREEEYAVLELLDGRRSLDDILRACEQRIYPRRITADEIMQFVVRLHDQGLVISEAVGQASELLARRRRQLRRTILKCCVNPLVIRFRGIDPHKTFEYLYRFLRPLFTMSAGVTSGVLILCALVTATVCGDELWTDLRRLATSFTPTTLLVLTAAIASVKVLHELGHGLTCRHFGGECHELGLMLLLFCPCLYCNVSDAWRFPGRWQRIAVAAAGIYVELNLAAVATFLWWFSAAGLLHDLSLSVIVICSANTILLNGNPLLRYDGYFILADLIATPNLADTAAKTFHNFVARLMTGEPVANGPSLPLRRGWYLTYHLASVGYRWIVTCSILAYLMAAARNYRLELLVRVLAILLIGSFVARPMWRLVCAFITGRARVVLSRARSFVAAAVAVASIGMFFLLPLPKRVWGPLEIELRSAQRLFVEVPGLLVEQTARPGMTVRAGAVVARLESDELEFEIDRLKLRADVLRAQISAAKRERFLDPAAGVRLRELNESLADAIEQLRIRSADRERLTLVASRDGTIFPATAIPTHERSTTDPRHRVGPPTAVHNLGCSLDAGTQYAEIGDPRQWNALVVIQQDDVADVHPGQSVEFVFDELPDVVFAAKIDEIAEEEFRTTPKQLSNKGGGEIATRTDAGGMEVPLTRSYQVRAAFDDPDAVLRTGLRGVAKIRVAPEPLGVRLIRWCTRTFHVRL